MIKKLALALLSICLALSCLAACNAGNGNTTTETEAAGTEAVTKAETTKETTAQTLDFTKESETALTKSPAFISNGDGTCYVDGRGDFVSNAFAIPAASPAGDRVTGIGAYAFANCTDLQAVILPATMKSIDEGAFQGCVSLYTMAIPAGVTTIGASAFQGCTSLARISYAGTVAQWEAVAKGDAWCDGTLATEVICTDGTADISAEAESEYDYESELN